MSIIGRNYCRSPRRGQLPLTLNIEEGLLFEGELSFMGELQFAPTMGHKHCQYIANEGK